MMARLQLHLYQPTRPNLRIERHEHAHKVPRWLLRPGRMGAFEAGVWVRGRCLGGAASFLDKGGRAFIVAIQEHFRNVMPCLDPRLGPN